MSPTTFGLLRHGKTEWNREGRIQGSADSPLTQEGINETEQWGKFLKEYNWTRIISSPLGRTQKTSEILNRYLDVPVQIEEGLREQHWGDWEGVNKEALYTEHAQDLNKQISRGWEFRPPNGESRNEVLSRIRKALFTLSSTYPGEKILIVSHQGVILTTIYHLSKRQFLPHEPKLLVKRTLHLIEARQDTLSIDKLNISKDNTILQHSLL